MSKLALGIIETVGLAAAIEAADTAVKSANVTLLGYELTKGFGLVTVKIEGNVGAVKAAIEAGCAAAERVSKVWSKQVIPRPHVEIDDLIFSKETFGLSDDKVKSRELQESLKEEDKEEEKIIDTKVDAFRENEEEEKSSVEEKESEESLEITEKDGQLDSDKVMEIKKTDEVCNLCGDPKCPRKKGESKTICIHYDKVKKKKKKGRNS